MPKKENRVSLSDYSSLIPLFGKPSKFFQNKHVTVNTPTQQ